MRKLTFHAHSPKDKLVAFHSLTDNPYRYCLMLSCIILCSLKRDLENTSSISNVLKVEGGCKVRIEAYFREYRDGMVRSMTIFSGDGQTAQDAVQQAFMKALTSRTMLEQMPEPAAKAWLYASARNALIDMKRKQSRILCVFDEDLSCDQLDQTEKIVVHSLISRLPSHLKQPICMKYFSRMNSTEIGRILDLPPATVRTRLRAAIGMMRDMMKGESQW